MIKTQKDHSAAVRRAISFVCRVSADDRTAQLLRDKYLYKLTAIEQKTNISNHLRHGVSQDPLLHHRDKRKEKDQEAGGDVLSYYRGARLGRSARDKKKGWRGNAEGREPLPFTDPRSLSRPRKLFAFARDSPRKPRREPVVVPLKRARFRFVPQAGAHAGTTVGAYFPHGKYQIVHQRCAHYDFSSTIEFRLN